MNCEQTQRKLSAWIDGELSETERKAVAEHLDCCACCADEAKELEAVDCCCCDCCTVEPSGDLRKSVMQQIEATPDEASRVTIGWLEWLRGLSPRPVIAMAASGVVLLTLSGVLFWASHSEVRAEPVVMCEIEGMVCDGCGDQVREALENVPGVRHAEVDYRTGKARVTLNRGASVSFKELSSILAKTDQFRLVDIYLVTEPDHTEKGH